MGKVDELIRSLCPNGVEYKKISEIADTNIGLATSVTKNKASTGVRLLHNSDIQANRIVVKKDEFITEDFAQKNSGKILQYHDIITVHTGDVGTSAVIEEEYAGSVGFTTITTRIKNFEDVNPYYLCHYLNSHLCKRDIAKETISDRSNLNQKSFEKLVVPVPPMEVQREIVHILDEFTLLSAELSAELSARERQYEYYRNRILSCIDAEEMELGQVCDFIRGPFGGSLKKECFKKEGYAVYEQQHAIYGNLDIRYIIDEDKFKELKRFEVKSGDLIVSCSGTIGQVYIIPENAPKGIINQALLKLTPLEMVDKTYIKYFFENKITAELNNSARGGAIKNVPSVSELKKIKIMVPSISKQKEIVKQLDYFSNICFSMRDGIPAEIEARQKQFEYYRDKLLAFEEVS